VRGLRDHLDAELVELSYPATSRLRTAVCDLTWYPRLRAPHGADVLHCPTFRGPFRATTPLVVTVHDLAVLRHPEWFNRWTRTYSSVALPRVVRAARRVIAVSEFTKRELVELLAVPENRISVVPNGVEDVFTASGPKADGDYVLAGELGHRPSTARDDRAAAGERLGDRYAEAFVERGVDEAAGAAVERCKFRVARAREPGDVRRRLDAAPAAGADDP
jgi:glycosyltransferase involved in cell wall biosynthesis